MNRRRIDWTGNPEEGPQSETTYYRYVRALDGQLVPIDTVKQNGKVIPLFPREVVDPYYLPGDAESPDYRELVEEVCQRLNQLERRRWLLAIRDWRSITQIAEIEGRSRQAIIDCFRRMARKNPYVGIWRQNKNQKNQYE